MAQSLADYIGDFFGTPDTKNQDNVENTLQEIYYKNKTGSGVATSLEEYLRQSWSSE